jgi:hypothetical protein
MPSFGLGRCDRRHKLLFEYPIIFWTPRGSLTAMAATHPDRGGIPHRERGWSAHGRRFSVPTFWQCSVSNRSIRRRRPLIQLSRLADLAPATISAALSFGAADAQSRVQSPNRRAQESRSRLLFFQHGCDARQRPGRQLRHNPFWPTQFSPHAGPNRFRMPVLSRQL